MKDNIKQIMESKYDQDINYAKIINKIDERKQNNYLRYLKPIGAFATCVLVLMVVVNNFPSMSKDSYKEEMSYDLMPNDYAGNSSVAYYNADNSYVKDSEVQEAKIIHTANISFETKDFDASYKALMDLVNKYDGYILSSDVHTNEYDNTTYHNGEYTVRIPVNNYTNFMTGYDVIGNVSNVSSNQDDITDTYIDIQTRIETLKAQEKRLIEILAQAENLSDMITIEDKLTDVRYNIESYQSRLNYYTKVTDYATVTIYISEVVNYSNNNKIINALNDTIDNFLGFLEDLAVFAIYALPFVLLIALIVFIVIKIKKRNKK